MLFIFSGYITEVASMKKDKAGFYFQILGFCFSLGGMISPLVARSFLAPEIDDYSVFHCNLSIDNLEDTKFSGETTEHDNVTYFQDSLKDLGVTLNTTSVDCVKQFTETNVIYVYLITAVFLALVAMLFMVASILDATNRKPTKFMTDKIQQNTKSEEITLYKRIIFISLMSFLLFLYVGTEVTFAGFLSSFTLLQLSWSQSKGAIVTSVFWIAFGLARFAGIWLSKILKTVTFMFTFPSLLIVSYCLFLLSISVNNDSFVMICVGMVGVSMSVIFSSIFTWTSENITMVTDQISALFIASCSVGVMLFPLLFGYMMDLYSPLWFNYLLIGIGALWLTIFSITFILSKHLLSAHTEEIAEKQPFKTAK